MECIVYKFTLPNKDFYIGKTIDLSTRINGHWRESRRALNESEITRKCKSINEQNLSKDDFRKCFTIEFSGTEEQCLDEEARMIQKTISDILSLNIDNPLSGERTKQNRYTNLQLRDIEMKEEAEIKEKRESKIKNLAKIIDLMTNLNDHVGQIDTLMDEEGIKPMNVELNTILCEMDMEILSVASKLSKLILVEPIFL